MKHLHFFAAIAAALAMSACGGGSGSGSSSSGGSGLSTTTPAGAHIEAVVLHPTTFDDGSQSDGQTFILQDPQSLQASDQVQFELVYYNAAGARIVLPAAQWTTNDTASTFGQISYNNGIFVASTAQTLSPQIVSVTYNNLVYNAFYSVLPRQVRLRGIVESDTTHKPLVGVELDFYGLENPDDPTSPEVFRGRTLTQSDGTYRASVPNTATGFTLVNNTLPTAYQRIYRFKGSAFNTGDTSCLAPTPSQSNGQPLINGEYFMINYANTNLATNGTVLLVPTSEAAPAATCGS